MEFTDNSHILFMLYQLEAVKMYTLQWMYFCDHQIKTSLPFPCQILSCLPPFVVLRHKEELKTVLYVSSRTMAAWKETSTRLLIINIVTAGKTALN